MEIRLNPSEDQKLKAEDCRAHARSPILPDMPCNMEGLIPPGFAVGYVVRESMQYLLENIQGNCRQLPCATLVVIPQFL